MTTLQRTFGLILVLSMVALCQQPQTATAAINLDGSNTTIVDTSGSGSLESIACRVTSVPSGEASGSTYIFVAADGVSGTSTVIYGAYSTTWYQDVAQFSYGSTGSNVGDSFVLPFNGFHYASSLKIEIQPGGGSGALTCSVQYN